MQAVSVGTSPVQLAPAGNRDFIHIFNNGASTLYVSYDGDPTTLSAANGIPVPPNSIYTLDNVGVKMIYNKAVWGIAGTGTLDVRLQGV